MIRERKFGLVTLTSLVVASMIGAGIFTTSGFALADLGTPTRVMWAWIVGAGIALCGAASYGMLARRMAESGGEYLYLSRTIHPIAGFIAGWVSLLAGFTGSIAFAASTLEAYLVPQGERPPWLPVDGVAVAAIVAGGVLHGIRAEVGAVTQNLTVILKVAVLAGFVLLGALFLADGSAVATHAGSTPALAPSAFAMSVVWISLSYSGFNAAVYVAGEAEDAERTVPRALIIGTLVVSVVYLGLNTVFVFAPPLEAVTGAPDVAAVAARSLGGETVELAARLVIALALFTSVTAMIMAGPRVYARMAADGLMPRVFAFEGRVPRAAIVLQAVLAIAAVLITGLPQLLSYLGFTLSLSAAAAVAGLFVVHARERRCPVESRAYPWIPALYVVATLALAAMAAGESPVELAAAAVTLVSGAVLYGLIDWRRRAATR